MNKQLGAQRFSKVSSWKSATRATACLLHISCTFNKSPQTPDTCKSWNYYSIAPAVEECLCAKKIIIKAVQEDTYAQACKSLEKMDKLFKQPPWRLRPFHYWWPDKGRRSLKFQLEERRPLIIPGKHHIVTLLVRWHHEKVRHQGWHFTEGDMHAARYWIVGGKSHVCSVIHECVTCRKLRGEP